MLLSLIAVLVLLVIAFYSVWMVVTGRVGGNADTELSTGGRVIIAGIALMAFGFAYAAYHPVGGAATEVVEPAPAREAASPALVAQAVRANPMPVGRTSDSALPDSAEPVETTALPELATPVSEKSAPTTQHEPEGRLSESAAAMEASAGKRSAVTTAPRIFASKPVPVAAAEAAIAEEPRAALPRSAARPASTPRPRGQRSYGPLLIHIDNALGDDQRSEQLTLRIEGKPVADIDIDSSQPAVAVAVALPRPGLLHYRLEGLSDDGVGSRLKGEGCIHVDDGARYVVRRKSGSRRVFLQRVRATR